MTMAFIALLMIVGISASATRASRSALAHEADSANIKQQAAADSQKINEGSVVDEVIWVVGDEAILKSDVEVTRLQAEAEGFFIPIIIAILIALPVAWGSMNAWLAHYPFRTELKVWFFLLPVVLMLLISFLK